MSLRLAILGATGIVGRTLLEMLEQRQWLPEPPRVFGSSRSAGTSLAFRGQDLEVLEPSEENLSDLDLVISAANGEVSEHIVPKALRCGVKLVIDTDSYYRMREDVPLVAVGVNESDISQHRGIVAGPNCSTAQLIVPLYLLHRCYGLRRVVVSTYQSVSGAGKSAIDELRSQAGAVLAGEREPRASDYAFNVIPQISKMLPDGSAKEEWKVVSESRKMLHLPKLPVSCTAVRVPVLVGHSAALNLELDSHCEDLDKVAHIFASNPYLQVWPQGENPTPVAAAGTDPVHVGRIRRDCSTDNGLSFWVTADNLRIGAALNALRIAEVALERGWLEQASYRS